MQSLVRWIHRCFIAFSRWTNSLLFWSTNDDFLKWRTIFSRLISPRKKNDDKNVHSLVHCCLFLYIFYLCFGNFSIVSMKHTRIQNLFFIITSSTSTHTHIKNETEKATQIQQQQQAYKCKHFYKLSHSNSRSHSHSSIDPINIFQSIVCFSSLSSLLFFWLILPNVGVSAVRRCYTVHASM